MKSFKEYCECVVRFDRRETARWNAPNGPANRRFIGTTDTLMSRFVIDELTDSDRYDVLYLVLEPDEHDPEHVFQVSGLFGEYTDDNGCQTYHTMIGNDEYTSLLMGGMMDILYREHYIPESCSQFNLPIKPSELINLRRTLFNVLREMEILHGECVEAGNEQDGERAFQAQIDSIRASISAVDNGIYGDVEARVDADIALEQTLKGEEA